MKEATATLSAKEFFLILSENKMKSDKIVSLEEENRKLKVENESLNHRIPHLLKVIGVWKDRSRCRGALQVEGF